MRRLNALLLLSLSLAILLGVASGTGQTATAQQPTVDLNAPATSFDDAVRTVASDSALVDLAATLLEARAETDISYSAYRKAVWAFRKHHPTFYGNFFGDPIYASYDAQYERLVWKRRVIETEINPRTSIHDSTPFLCDPLSYDPAFSGVCNGFKFAASDFFRLPSFIKLRQPEPRTRFASAAGHRPSSNRTPAADLEQSAASAETDSSPRPDPIVSPAGERVAVSIQVPEEVASRMQRTAADLRRDEIRERVREMVEEEYGDDETLMPEERGELADRLAETAPTSDGRADVASHVRNHLERIEDIRDRLERAGHSRFRPERTSSSHRPPVSRTSASAPSPSSNTGSRGSPEIRPPTPDRSDVQRNESDAQ